MPSKSETVRNWKTYSTEARELFFAYTLGQLEAWEVVRRLDAMLAEREGNRRPDLPEYPLPWEGDRGLKCEPYIDPEDALEYWGDGADV